MSECNFEMMIVGKPKAIRNFLKLLNGENESLRFLGVHNCGVFDTVTLELNKTDPFKVKKSLVKLRGYCRDDLWNSMITCHRIRGLTTLKAQAKAHNLSFELYGLSSCENVSNKQPILIKEHYVAEPEGTEYHRSGCLVYEYKSYDDYSKIFRQYAEYPIRLENRNHNTGYILIDINHSPWNYILYDKCGVYHSAQHILMRREDKIWQNLQNEKCVLI